MNSGGDKMATHLTTTLGVGVGLGGFVLALFAPGPLLPKIAVTAALAFALVLVATWHHGYRAGHRGRPRE